MGCVRQFSLSSMKLLESSWGQNMELIHLGGEKTVTGSCHLLRVNGVNILVDCGLAQGGDRVLPLAEKLEKS